MSSKALESMLGDKKLGIVMGNDPSLGYDRLPFGVPSLDKLTGGGLPKKRMTIIYGPSGVGKTFLASKIVSELQKKKPDAKIGWVDTEQTWDKDWQYKCGVNPDTIAVSQPDSGEQAFDVMKFWAGEQFDLIVLDSTAGIVPMALLDNDFSYNPMAWQARFLNQSLPKFIGLLKNNTAFVMINQVRSSIGPVALGNLPGGEGQKFYAHVMLRVTRKEWIKDPPSSEHKVGWLMRAELTKSKVGADHYESATVPFRMEGGIDMIETFIRDALNLKLIVQTGAWYSWRDGEKMQGMNGVKGFFQDNDEEFELLQQAVLDAS